MALSHRRFLASPGPTLITRRIGLIALGTALTGRKWSSDHLFIGRSAASSSAAADPGAGNPSTPGAAGAIGSPSGLSSASKPGLKERLQAATLPQRYDEPLGIGLEGWPYPAPVKWHECEAGSQAVRMAYMDVAPSGPSRGKTVVLLHGKTFDSSYWSGVIQDLSRAGYRVIVPDQIGFNKSSKPDLAYSLDMLAELTVNLLAGQQIGTFTAIGHSVGGLIAIRIAAASPGKIERLILEAPVGLVDYHRFVPVQSTETLVAAERRRTLSSYRAFMRTFCPSLPATALEPFVEWRMRLALSGEYERFCRASALTYQMIYRETVRDQIGDITAPTLIIVGDKDRSAPLRQYAPPDNAARIPAVSIAAADAAKELRKGTLLVLPDIGHVPHLEAPDAFRSAVLAFLAKKGET